MLSPFGDVAHRCTLGSGIGLVACKGTMWTYLPADLNEITGLAKTAQHHFSCIYGLLSLSNLQSTSFRLQECTDSSWPLMAPWVHSLLIQAATPAVEMATLRC